MLNKIKYQLQKPVPAVSLAFFRIAFGLLMLGGTLRFILKDWVQELYVAPKYFFSYYGFEWVKPLPEWAIYTAFGLVALFSTFIALGYFYRFSIIAFFIVFSYIELIDKALYLNHYYFITLISFVMIFLPLNCKYSLDVLRKPALKSETIPNWILFFLRMQVGFVYFFGGVAKIKWDWLFEAQPLKIWLSANTNFPLIGSLLDDVWVAYVIAWLAMIFDLGAPFLLSFKRTRIYIYGVIVVFHALTAKLFYIGMFPYIMMVAALIFFPPNVHQQVLDLFKSLFSKIFILKQQYTGFQAKRQFSGVFAKASFGIISLLFLYQLVMPFRYFFYPDRLCWSEEGFRYGWNIMLIEKNGHVDFNIREPETGKEWIVLPAEHLTPLQQKQMSTQPDMILQFAHYVAEMERANGHKNIEVRAECHVSLNGTSSRLLIDPTVDLTKEKENLKHKNWILPFNQQEQLAIENAKFSK